MESRMEEITLDARRRTSLAKVGRRDDTKYLAETHDDGTIVLIPAATVSKLELAALRDPRLRKRMEDAATVDPATLIRRGSFAEYADEDG